MSIPYLGYCSADDPIYQNTRRFALSKENPFYYEGAVAKGIGSPHTPPDYIWHMALSMQGITAQTAEEKLEMIACWKRPMQIPALCMKASMPTIQSLY